MESHRNRTIFSKNFPETTPDIIEPSQDISVKEKEPDVSFIQGIMDKCTFQPKPGAAEKSKQFVSYAINVCQTYEIDTVITEYGNQITVDMYIYDSYYSGEIKHSLETLIRLSDDFSMACDKNRPGYVRLSMSYHTHEIYYRGKKDGMVMKINKEKACSFTGHRDIPNEMADYLAQRIMAGINYLYGKDIKTFLTGGALGFDTLAAQTVMKCRELHNDIRLILVIPCRDQAQTWKQADTAIYEQIKRSADEVVCLSEHYYQGCMHERNRYLIDNSSTCICYLTQMAGGTAYTVKYARNKGRTVFNLARDKENAERPTSYTE